MSTAVKEAIFFPEASATQGTFPVTVVSAVEAADGIRALTLTRPGGEPLPEWGPGAHIDVHISPEIIRQYSLSGSPANREAWRIGILREPESRGGSEAIHDRLEAGDTIWVSEPKNNFNFGPAKQYLFIAGGIGITPLIPMIKACHEAGADWRLVYGGRSLSSMAFTDELLALGDRVTLWPQDTNGHIDLAGLLDAPDAETEVYCCGPGPLLQAVEGKFDALDPGLKCALHIEHFKPKELPKGAINLPFTVICDYSDVEVEVGADESILDAVQRAGIQLPSSCREGTCGTCETVVLEGIPEHRDSFLTKDEQASNEVMTPCCSRSKTPVLVLDL
ncbi:PDR/VanB family oxidoreductase [Leucobacter denitrificans]|uniref:Oxidoreductase n=1 Tax=Leucobacter denitrificans TaxID=683042 RepID=A0A7G9S5D1_9MICO|nr:PDR/VanB family oxidoreductase [Leucobacter denitrificans]QNN63056.1 oxidoreductase [Leucobacter denitrificans]